MSATQNDTQAVPRSLLGDMADFITKAAHLLRGYDTRQTAFDQEINSTLDVLVSNSVIDATQRTKMAVDLSANPANALKLLRNIAGFVKPASLGNPLPEPKKA